MYILCSIVFQDTPTEWRTFYADTDEVENKRTKTLGLFVNSELHIFHTESPRSFKVWLQRFSVPVNRKLNIPIVHPGVVFSLTINCQLGNNTQMIHIYQVSIRIVVIQNLWCQWTPHIYDLKYVLTPAASWLLFFSINHDWAGEWCGNSLWVVKYADEIITHSCGLCIHLLFWRHKENLETNWNDFPDVFMIILIDTSVLFLLW